MVCFKRIKTSECFSEKKCKLGFHIKSVMKFDLNIYHLRSVFIVRPLLLVTDIFTFSEMWRNFSSDEIFYMVRNYLA